MSTTTIVCPSGLAGEIRGLKGKEGKILSNRNAARTGATFDRLLSACWLATTATGIYDFAADAPVDWSKVLVADRFYTLLQIRSLSFGDEYSFAVQCANAICRKRFEWSLQLSDLPVIPLTESSRATFCMGNRFEARFPRAERRVWFRLLTGADEMRNASVRRSGDEDLLMTSLASRIIEIEGIPEQNKRQFLDDIEMADATALLDQFDEADGGVETSLEVECPVCLGIQEVQLPFERGFFLPTAKTGSATR
jgi:hypothetical protein